MASTIKEIANGMKVEFIKDATLCNAFGLTYDHNRDDEECVSYYNQNFSAVSVETCLIYIVAACAAALENMFDWFKQDVNEIVANERYGHKGWYEAKAREFHYTDQTTQEEVYPITHASCEELNFGIKLKVAKGEPGSLSALDLTEQTPFETWMERQKPAGIPIHYVHQDADKIRMRLTVYYDPVEYVGRDVEEIVTTAITNHLQGIDFNGVFTTTALVDSLQKVEGISLIEIHEVYAQPVGEAYQPIEQGTRDVPDSGWYELDEENTVITALPLL